MEQPGCDEAQWVLAAKRGSEEGWRHLVAAHEDWLMRLAWRLTGRRGVAEELVQETFVEAVDGIRRLRDNGAFRAWIRTILMRAVQRYWRRKRPTSPTRGPLPRRHRSMSFGRPLTAPSRTCRPSTARRWLWRWKPT